ncbi:MAG: PKD domain-containing protein, partial [Phycisphaerales bacterium]|nr:PKD domain-containing protein [Phycisphaerales bacterium]
MSATPTTIVFGPYNTINPLISAVPFIPLQQPNQLSPIDYEIKLEIDGGICGILTATEIITINPLPYATFTTNPAQTITPTSCETIIPEGNPMEILLNGNTLPNLPPNLPYNTDYIEITATGSDIPFATIFPTDPLPLVWPQIFRTFASVGNYQICIEAFNACGSDIFCCDVNVTINLVDANFIPQIVEGCEEVDVFTFTNESTYDPFNSTQWCKDWNASISPPSCNGSLLPNPAPLFTFPLQPTSWIYDDPGYYYVYQITTNNSTTIYDEFIWPTPMTVHPKPDADFIPHDACVNEEGEWFDDSSIDPLPGLIPQESIASREWFVSNDGGLSYTPTGITSSTLTHTFLTPGSWVIKLTCTSNNGCSASRERPITVHELPTAGFTSDFSTICVDSDVIFNGNTGIPGGSNNSLTGLITEWNWDFGDPTFSTTSNPNTYSSSGASANGDADHNYTQPGSYDITLTVTDENTCSSLPIPHTIIVKPAITAAAVTNPECLGDNTEFTATGSTSTATEFLWDFDATNNIDATTTSISEIALHEYLTPGFHDFILTVRQDLGNGQYCTDTTGIQQVYVYTLPVADFTFNTACEDNSLDINEITNFINTPFTQIDGTINHWDWVFENPVGCTACPSITTYPSAPNTDYTFSAANFIPGYVVNLIAYDNNGCQSITVPHNVPVSNLPEADITFTSSISGLEACEGDIVSISSTGSTYTDFSPNTVSWNINPAASITSPLIPSTTVDLTAPGIYTLSLDITDANGCPATTSVVIHVWENPTADFTLSTILCENNPITFTADCTDGDGSINDWQWHFGIDSDPPTFATNVVNNSVDVSYLSNGPKDITLEVIDDNGCSDFSDPLSIMINPLPTAHFTSTKVCAGQPVEFTNSSSPIGNIASYNLTFSDGININTTTFPNLLSIPYEYTYINPIDPFLGAKVGAELIITDQENCKDTFADVEIEIHPLPSIHITTLLATCEGNNFVFEDSSFVDDTEFNDDLRTNNSPNTQTWIYNSLTESTDLPIWIFPATDPPGIYQISLGRESNHLSEHNNQYCSFIETFEIEIAESPKLTNTDTSFIPTDKCGEGVLYNFDVTHDNVATWEYIITNSNTSLIFDEDEEEDFNFQFTFPGIYDLTINLSNNNSCKDTIP